MLFSGEVGIAEGLTALHVLLMHGWRCPGVLEVVLEAKADVNLVSKGRSFNIKAIYFFPATFHF